MPPGPTCFPLYMVHVVHSGFPPEWKVRENLEKLNCQGKSRYFFVCPESQGTYTFKMLISSKKKLKNTFHLKNVEIIISLLQVKIYVQVTGKVRSFL